MTSSTLTPAESGSGAAKNLYLIQQPVSGPGAILQFAAASNGVAAPSSSVTPSSLTLTSVFADTAGQVYAAGTAASGTPNGEIEVFAAGASGAATPARTIVSGSTTYNSSFYKPTSLWVDSGGILYVAGGNASISVFSATASGAVTPFRFLQGSLTQITSPNGVAVDGTGNIYVANGTTTSGSILVFAATANGNVAPSRVITLATGSLLGVPGISIDTAGNVYVVSSGAGGAGSSIVEFAAGASGPSTPLRTIGGSASGLGSALGVSIDGVGYIYVLNQPSGAATGNIVVFAAAATGNASPALQFTSNAWTAPALGQLGLY